MQKKTIVVTALLTFIVTFIVFSVLLISFLGPACETVLVEKLLTEHYVEPFEHKNLLSGMVSSLEDPYSAYLDREEFSSLMSSIKSEYKGIGIEAYVDENNFISVLTVFDNSPAKAAGIKPNDKITEILGKKVSGDNFEEAISLIRGNEDDAEKELSLTVLRGNESLVFKVSRDVVEMQTVSSRDYDNAKYVKLSYFYSNTFTDFKKAVADAGNKPIIVDLRDNPGGLLTSAVDIADYLLPKADIVYTENNKGERKYYKSDESHIENRIIILCNERSASASEVLTAALCDNGRATALGEKTFGKGCVQEIYPLPKGSGLKVTSSYYYTPSGVCIHGEGITPDETISLAEDDKNKSVDLLTKEEDLQLIRALELLK